MDIVTSPEQMQAIALSLRRAGQPIGFVPTMGCLHPGHLALIKLARKASGEELYPNSVTSGPRARLDKGQLARAATLVVSIFVNPTQFGQHEDYNTYPRNFDNDRQLCLQAGVDIIFHPAAEFMYSKNPSISLDESALSKTLCGAARPGHFRGVLTVVAKLFNLVLPDVAVFGQKDAQQARLIQQMIHDLNFPVRLVRGPIIREPDGLAMSSRNNYLTPPERQDALCLVKSLQLARALYQAGARDSHKILTAMQQKIDLFPSAAIDYVAAVDGTTLQPVTKLADSVMIALAVRIGTTRLIDNLILPDDQLCQVPL